MMQAPSTPKKQLRCAEPTQQLTPPPTLDSKKKSTAATEYRYHDAVLVTPTVDELEQKTAQLPGKTSLWLYSSTSPEQRRQRFRAFLHSLWPSNDEFNAARHPLYDSEEDGPYEVFIKNQSNGHYPYDDDDYDSSTDPSRSTEAWQPSIGDEGIENEHDLQVVLEARHEHQTRAERLRRRKGRVAKAQLRAGVKAADNNLDPVFIEPNADLANTSSEFNSGPDRKEAANTPENTPANNMEPTSTTTATKETGVGDHEPRKGTVQSRSNMNKKKRNGRKRGANGRSDKTYKYNDASDSENGKPVRKKGKSANHSKAAGSDVSADNMTWKAQTRSTARRAT